MLCFVIVATSHGPMVFPYHSCLSEFLKIYMPPFVNGGVVAEAFANSYDDSSNSCTTTSCTRFMVVVIYASACNGCTFFVVDHVQV